MAIELDEELVDELISKLTDVCASAWDRYTDHVIVPYNKYTYEEQLERGDSYAYELLKKLQKLQQDSI